MLEASNILRHEGSFHAVEIYVAPVFGGNGRILLFYWLSLTIL
jgi:hypothetical protein